MIDLYFWTTDNGYKARTAMEESGLPHKLIPINIRNREQDRKSTRLNSSH